MQLRVIEGGNRLQARRGQPWGYPKAGGPHWHMEAPSKRYLERGPYQIEVRRGRLEPVDPEDREGVVDWRKVVCTVRQADEEVGLLLFVELRVAFMCSNIDLWDALDGVSMDDSTLAEAIVFNWRDVGADVGQWGNIIELREGGMWRVADPRLLDRLIERLWPRHALLLMQALPLNAGRLEEYTKDEEDRRELRIQALRRVCERTFGMAMFEGDAGEDGWFYRIPERVQRFVKRPWPSSDAFGDP